MNKKFKIAGCLVLSSLLAHTGLYIAVKKYKEMCSVMGELLTNHGAITEISKVVTDLCTENNSEKKEGFYRVDFHVHMDKKESYASLEHLFSTLTQKVEMVVITSHFPGEKSQLTYSEIKNLVLERKRELAFDDYGDVFRLSDGEKELFFVKGQEVTTREGFHVIVIGKEIHDVMGLEQLIQTAEKEGIAIISHPYSVPRTGILNKEKETLLAKVAGYASALEGFNASNTLWFSVTNVKSREFAKKYHCATVVGSDMHHNLNKIGMSCTYIKKEGIDFSNEKSFLESLEHAIREDQNVHHTEYCGILSLYKDFFTGSPEREW